MQELPDRCFKLRIKREIETERKNETEKGKDERVKGREEGAEK
jgi:hypothetical protein